MLKTLEWFTARIGKDVIRTYKDNDTQVTIVKGEKADKYMFGLQDEGFTFRDTAETLAEASTVPQEASKPARPRIHISDDACTACEG